MLAQFSHMFRIASRHDRELPRWDAPRAWTQDDLAAFERRERVGGVRRD